MIKKTRMLFQIKNDFTPLFVKVTVCLHKVLIEKSRGEGSLMEQDTIENVSKHKFLFFYFLRKKNIF